MIQSFNEGQDYIGIAEFVLTAHGIDKLKALILAQNKTEERQERLEKFLTTWTGDSRLVRAGHLKVIGK